MSHTQSHHISYNGRSGQPEIRNRVQLAADTSTHFETGVKHHRLVNVPDVQTASHFLPDTCTSSSLPAPPTVTTPGKRAQLSLTCRAGPSRVCYPRGKARRMRHLGCKHREDRQHRRGRSPEARHRALVVISSDPWGAARRCRSSGLAEVT